MGETTPRDDLGRRAVRGAAVTGISQAARLVLQVASVVILARLVTPRDYGLVAMVLAVIGVAEFLRECGLGAAAVRAESLSTKERDNLFWINSGLGILFTAVTMTSAPLIAAAYSVEELVLITLALAPTFALGGFSAQYRVDLLRKLRFASLAWIEVTCAALGLAVGVGMALAGAGYWSLVAQQVASGVVALASYLFACRWLPGAYDRSTPVGGFVRLGSAFMFGSVLAYIARNADNVLIGHQFGATSLGIYTRSMQLVRTPLTQLQAPFATVALPVLVAAGVEDARLVSTARTGQAALAYPLMAISAVVVAGSTAIVEVALGPPWRDAAPIMAWIACGGALSCLSTPAMWLFSVRGLARAVTGFNLVATTLTLSAILIGAQWGVEGVAAATVASGALQWPIALAFAKHYGDLRVAPLVRGGLRVTAVAAVAALVGRVVVGSVAAGSPGAQVAAATGSVVAVFLLAGLLPGYRQDYRTLVTLTRLLKSARPA